MMELNKNPENYFADVEQAAFNPASVVPGISFSPDRMLQGRLFSYGDAQRYRLGVNHHLIPVNQARCPVHGFSRDGAMRVDGNYGCTPTTSPTATAVAGAAGVRGAAAGAGRRCRPLGLPRRRRRLLHAARPAVPADGARSSRGALRETPPGAMGDAAEEVKTPPHRQLPQGRPGLRRRSGRRARHPDERAERVAGGAPAR